MSFSHDFIKITKRIKKEKYVNDELTPTFMFYENDTLILTNMQKDNVFVRRYNIEEQGDLLKTLYTERAQKMNIFLPPPYTMDQVLTFENELKITYPPLLTQYITKVSTHHMYCDKYTIKVDFDDSLFKTGPRDEIFTACLAYYLFEPFFQETNVYKE
jgi:hypothetical protein